MDRKVFWTFKHGLPDAQCSSKSRITFIGGCTPELSCLRKQGTKKAFASAFSFPSAASSFEYDSELNLWKAWLPFSLSFSQKLWLSASLTSLLLHLYSEAAIFCPVMLKSVHLPWSFSKQAFVRWFLFLP